MFQFVKFQNENIQDWDEFNISSDGTFLTSHKWIEFQESLGKIVDRYFIVKSEKVSGILYIEIYKRKLSKYAYSPYSPVLSKDIIENSKELNSFLRDFKNFQNRYLQEKDLNVFRFDPFWKSDLTEQLKIYGFKKSLAPTQAKHTWIVDVNQSEDVLLANMKKVARYNIKSSQKFGIEVSKIQSRSQVEKFYEILSGTQSKKNFSTHDISYFLNQYDRLYSASMMDIYFASFKGKLISTALINKLDKKAYYTHGGSITSREFQKYGASYLLQWEIIRDLQRQGFESYNMWGVLPEGLTNHLSGVSDFKKRFGGKMVELIGGFETRRTSISTTLQLIMEYSVYRKERY